MITIKKPYLERVNDKSRCICEVIVDGESREIWFETECKYENFLVTERADAYVIGLLHFALTNNHDIVCEIPMTDELLYNITTILIPALCKANSELNTIVITATCEEALGGSEVGTGCSCGIDSLDAIYMHNKSKFERLDVTYLTINNVGAFNECYGKDLKMVKEERYKASRLVSTSLQLPLIQTDSNFADVFPQNHLMTHTYSSCFAIYMMKKMWRIYYYASAGVDYTHFSLTKRDPAYYELLSLQCFSTSGLKIYSEGGEKNRFEKTKDIVKFELAQKHLHVCLTKHYNCGVCSKCRRTLVTLDALECLDSFSSVFNIAYYKENIRGYYTWLARQHLDGDEMNEPVFREMMNRRDFRKVFAVEVMLNPLRKIKYVIKMMTKT